VIEMVLTTVSMSLLNCISTQYMQQITLVTTPTCMVKTNINQINLNRCGNMNITIINNDYKTNLICIVKDSYNINIKVIGGGGVFVYLYDSEICSLSFQKGTKSGVIVLGCCDVCINADDEDMDPPVVTPPDLTPPDLTFGVYNSIISVKLPLTTLLLFSSGDTKNESTIKCSLSNLPNRNNIHRLLYDYGDKKIPSFELLKNLTGMTVFNGILGPPLIVSPDADADDDVDDGDAADDGDAVD